MNPRDGAVALPVWPAEDRWTPTRSNCWSSTRSASCSPATPRRRSARTWPGSVEPSHRRRRDPRRAGPRHRDGRRPSGQGQRRRSAGCTTSACSSAAPPSARMLTAEQLLEVAETLACTGAMYRYRMRLADRLVRPDRAARRRSKTWALVGKTITGCIDGRGHVLDMASRELAAGPPASSPTSTRSVQARDQAAAPRPGAAQDPPLPQRDRQRRPLRPAGRRQPPAQGRRASSTASAAPARRSSSSRPSVAAPQRRAGRPQGARRTARSGAILRRLSGEVGRVAQAAGLRPRRDRPARPHHRQGPLQPRLRHVRPGREHRRPALAPAGAAPAARAPVPQRARQAARAEHATEHRARGRADRRPPRASASTCSSSPGRTPAARRSRSRRPACSA